MVVPAFLRFPGKTVLSFDDFAAEVEKHRATPAPARARLIEPAVSTASQRELRRACWAYQVRQLYETAMRAGVRTLHASVPAKVSSRGAPMLTIRVIPAMRRSVVLAQPIAGIGITHASASDRRGSRYATILSEHRLTFEEGLRDFIDALVAAIDARDPERDMERSLAMTFSFDQNWLLIERIRGERHERILDSALCEAPIPGNRLPIEDAGDQPTEVVNDSGTRIAAVMP